MRMAAKRTFIKLDHIGDLTFEIGKYRHQDYISIVNKNDNGRTCINYNEIFANIDKYKLLKLADFIYEHCNER